MKTIILSPGNLKPIRVTLKEAREGIEFTIPCHNRDLIEFQLRFIFEDDEEQKSDKIGETVYTVPGHPNCKFGDCDKECHNVACLIHQGYEEAPSSEKECDVHYKK